MEYSKMQIDNCANLLKNMTGEKIFYDTITDIIEEIKGYNDDSWTSLASKLIINTITILVYSFKCFHGVMKTFGVDTISLAVTVVVVYYVYKLVLKPINLIQDLNLPSDKMKKKEMINLERRLRKFGTKVPPPYPNGWFAIMESTELKPGEVKQADYLGENFAVFRTLDGVAHVSDAYCPHLGANLAVGGTVKDNCIECPFHKWKFEVVTGKCVSIPDLDAVPRGLNIKLWPTAEVDGAIFIWYDREGREPEWEVPVVEEIKSGYYKYHGRNEFLIGCHIQDIAENGGDVAHLNAIHGDNVISGKTLPTTDVLNIIGFNSWDGKWERTESPHIAQLLLNHQMKFFNKTITNLNVVALQYGPGHVRLTLEHRWGKFIFLQTLTPIEPMLQRLTHRLYAPWYFRPIANLMTWSETVMVHRDVMIWNKKTFINNPRLVKTDKCIKAFRAWFQQFYSPNSVPFKEAILGPAKDLTDW